MWPVYIYIFATGDCIGVYHSWPYNQPEQTCTSYITSDMGRAETDLTSLVSRHSSAVVVSLTYVRPYTHVTRMISKS